MSIRCLCQPSVRRIDTPHVRTVSRCFGGQLWALDSDTDRQARQQNRQVQNARSARQQRLQVAAADARESERRRTADR